MLPYPYQCQVVLRKMIFLEKCDFNRRNGIFNAYHNESSNYVITRVNGSNKIQINYQYRTEKMGDGNISTLLAALKLDEHSLVNQFLYIEEHYTADGSFILSSIIKFQIEKNHNIILVMCHNSFGHFHSISQKLGYNLNFLKESGRVYIIDILDKLISENFLNSLEPLKQLYFDIKNKLNEWGSDIGVCIIVENLGNLLLSEVQDFFAFTSYVRAIALERKNSSFVLSTHYFPDCSNFKTIAKLLRHTADITVCLKDLRTGRANDVTGHLIIRRKEKNYKKSTDEYQYQLQDKSISVFTPGSKGLIQ